MSNSNLHKAKRAKNDGFYTQLVDIEKELSNYPGAFEDKIVYCNCDDPNESNFVKYFKDNFEQLGLKKLLVNYLHDGEGDFRSEEAITLLKEADIVVTNPPFSLFREYVAQLIEYDKRFLIIGTLNAIAYKQIFPLLKYNKIWLGYTFPREFRLAQEAKFWVRVDMDGNKYCKIGNALWYTNLEPAKLNDKIVLDKKYTPEEYPHYNNYDAINVDRTANIPFDYAGVMGVPISFMTKYNPEQFEILGQVNPNIGGRKVYVRILIRRK